MILVVEVVTKRRGLFLLAIAAPLVSKFFYGRRRILVCQQAQETATSSWTDLLINRFECRGMHTMLPT